MNTPRRPKRRALIVAIVLLAVSAGGGVAFGAFASISSSTGSTVTAASTFARCYSDAVLANSPVGYWKVDETSGTTAVDATAGGHNGTYSGGYTLGQPGALSHPANKATTFNGTTGAVDFGNPAAFQLTTGTLEAWINTTTPGASYRTILVKQNAFGLYLKDGVLMTYDATAAVDRSSAINIADGKWHHVVMTFVSGAASGMSLYLDGGLVVTSQITVLLQTTSLQAGINQTLQPMAGSIDEPAIYNTVLTAAQIRAHYNAGRCYRDEPPKDTPLGLWRLNEPAGTTTAFDSQNTRRGTYMNGVVQAQTSGINGDTGKSATFDGVNDYVDVGNPAAFQLTVATVEAWVKAASPGASYRRIVGKDQAFGLDLKDGVLMAYDFGTGLDRSTGVNLADGRWHHVAMSVQSGTTNGTVIYADGVPVLTTTVTVANQTGSLTIGGAAGQYLNGSIDDVALYGSVISAARIEAHMIAGSSYRDIMLDANPVGYWRFGEAAGTVAADEKGLDAGTYSGTFTARGWIPLVSGDATTSNFSSSSGYVVANNPANMQMANGSFETWFMGASTAGGWLTYRASALGLAVTTTLNVYNPTTATYLSTGVNVADYKRHHIACTFQSGVTNGTKVYIDGVLKLTTTDTFVNQTGIWWLIYGLPGAMQDTAIYSTQLTPDQIKLHADAGVK